MSEKVNDVQQSSLARLEPGPCDYMSSSAQFHKTDFISPHKVATTNMIANSDLFAELAALA